jgi:hypothetical protein
LHGALTLLIRDRAVALEEASRGVIMALDADGISAHGATFLFIFIYIIMRASISEQEQICCPTGQETTGGAHILVESRREMPQGIS